MSSSQAAKNAKKHENRKNKKAQKNLDGGKPDPGEGSSKEPRESPTSGNGVPKASSGDDGNASRNEEEPPINLKELAMDALVQRAKDISLELSISEDDRKMPSNRTPVEVGGTSVEILTNYFSLGFTKLKALHMYSIKVTENRSASEENDTRKEPAKAGDIPGTAAKTNTISGRMQRRILWLLFEQQRSAMNKAATDYRQSLVSTATLPDHPASKPYNVDYYGESETQPRQGPHARSFTVVLDYIKSLPMENLRKFLQNPNDPDLPKDLKPEEFVTAFNMMISQIPNQDPNFQHVGSMSFFNLHDSFTEHVKLGNGLNARLGFTRSVRASHGQLSINVNSTGSAFYDVVRLDWLIDAWCESIEGQSENRIMLEKFIKGLRVETTYDIRNSKRVHTVFGLAPWISDRPTANKVTFSEDEKDAAGKKTGKRRKWTVQGYFDQKYPKTLTYSNALVINCGSRKQPIYIPSDALNVMKGNVYRRLLVGIQPGTMQQFASKPPYENVSRIMGHGRRTFRIDGSENVASPEHRFDIAISPEMLQIKGRVLPTPDLLFGNADRAGTVDGSWNLNKRKFAKLGRQAQWSCIQFSDKDTQVEPDELTNFINDLRTSIQTYCPNLHESRSAQIQIFRFPVGDPAAMQTILGQYRDVQVIFVVLPNKEASNYELLKHVAENKIGIHTICTVVNERRAALKSGQAIKHDQGSLANLMLKCNLKLGGDNWLLSAANRETASKFLSPTTMIVGADVTHPSPGSMVDVDSVAAVVATEDDGLNRYPASLRCQASKMEMIVEFDTMLGERLEHWRAVREAQNLRSATERLDKGKKPADQGKEAVDQGKRSVNQGNRSPGKSSVKQDRQPVGQDKKPADHGNELANQGKEPASPGKGLVHQDKEAMDQVKTPSDQSRKSPGRSSLKQDQQLVGQDKKSAEQDKTSTEVEKLSPGHGKTLLKDGKGPLQQGTKPLERKEAVVYYPEQIIIYRDGVSESQFQTVIELEYPQIQSVIQKKYDLVDQPHPRIMMLSVQKRHHTRFYPTHQKGSVGTTKSGNPLPGLIVDSRVTYAEKYNWFLQSHASLLGTARPAHYVVLVDTIKADTNLVHTATHWQCFLYGRATKSISIHPAARLADRACTRARAYLRKYYVAGNSCNDTFDRQGIHSGAWDHMHLHPAIKDSMFYV